MRLGAENPRLGRRRAIKPASGCLCLPRPVSDKEQSDLLRWRRRIVPEVLCQLSVRAGWIKAPHALEQLT